MVACAEQGDFRSPRVLSDQGVFTVQTVDVPLGAMRKKPRSLPTNQLKKVRLTPITEYDEVDRERTFSSMGCTDNVSPICPTVSPLSGSFDDLQFLSREGSFDKLDSFHRKNNVPRLLFDDLDAVEAELENITDRGCEDNNVHQTNDGIASLPPRPKCKRKVLPPSVTVTTKTDNQGVKKKIVTLRRRSNSVNNLDKIVCSPSRAINSDRSFEKIKPLADILRRPKSVENDASMLSNLSSTNSSSVPDLPSIFNKLSKTSDLLKAKTPEVDDSGALSTPRREPEKPLGPISWDKSSSSSLRGSDMSSFYNMWERDRKKKPMWKKSKAKEIKFYRSCGCSLKHCAEKCNSLKLKPLPPIGTAMNAA